MKFSFNLISEKWIPCLTLVGTLEEHSLRNVLRKAGQLREVHAQSPLVTVSLYRLLLAVLHRVYGPPSSDDWADMYESRKWDLDKLDQYFHEWGHRFDLFSDQYPFYQVRDFPEDKASPSARLALERASGNNDTLFDHNWDESGEPLSPAEAARYVLATQNYGLTGKSVSDHSSLPLPMKGVQVLVRGDDLWETLMLNLVPYDGKYEPFEARGHDEPLWEKEQFRFQKKPDEEYPGGYLDYLTFQNRYVKLFPECKEKEILVTKAGIAQGRKLPKTASPWHWGKDQFTVFVTKKAKEVAPLQLSRERAVWRDCDALLGVRSGSEKPEVIQRLGEHVELREVDSSKLYDVLIFGTSNTKANIYLWRREEVPLPAALLKDENLLAELSQLVGIAKKAADAVYETLSDLNHDLLLKPKPKRTNGDTARGPVMRLYWSALEIPFYDSMITLTRRNAGVRQMWVERVTGAAKHAFELGVKKLRLTARAIEAVVTSERYLRWKLSLIDEKEEEAA